MRIGAIFFDSNTRAQGFPQDKGTDSWLVLLHLFKVEKLLYVSA